MYACVYATMSHDSSVHVESVLVYSLLMQSFALVVMNIDHSTLDLTMVSNSCSTFNP